MSVGEKKQEALLLVMSGMPYIDAVAKVGISVKSLTNMPEYKAWRAKTRLESPPKKPNIGKSMLTRIGQVGKNKFNKMVGIYQCECGAIKEIMDHNVSGKYATTISCGCHTNSSDYKDAVKAGIINAWARGDRKELSEDSKNKVADALRKNAKARIGVARPPGPTEAGPDHCRALYWQLISPEKIVMEGMNLNHLIRTHSHLFDPRDLVWKNSMCRASKGLRQLLEPPKEGRPRSNSWKGWMIGDKMKREDAPK